MALPELIDTSSPEKKQGDVLRDPNALLIETVGIRGIDIHLVSCDHQPGKLPKKDPWGVIESVVRVSSLVFVEYFPHELQHSVYNNPLWGKLAQAGSRAKGIDLFFNRLTDLCVKYDKQIGVADIANSGIYSVYHGMMRVLPSAGLLLTENREAMAGILGLSMLWSFGMNFQELAQIGMFDLERKKFEKFMIDMEDARRLLTARGIQQEAERQVGESDMTYIGPRAHVSRIKWYLEHPEDYSSKVKGKIYSFAFGVPRSTRIYKKSHMFGTWQLVSEVQTQV